MKRTLLILLFFSSFFNAQIGIGTTNPDPSSILDIYSEDKGFLMPRLTRAQKDAIFNPAEGLLVYQKDINPGFYYFDGNRWISMQYKASNGLHKSNEEVRLGGHLIENTDVRLQSNTLNIVASDASSEFNLLKNGDKRFSFYNNGYFRFSTDQKLHAIHINPNVEYVCIGCQANESHPNQNDFFFDSQNNYHFIDFVLKIDDMTQSGGGTGIGMGSIEYFVDGTDEILVSCPFSPLDNNSVNCGTSNHRWKEIWSRDGVIQTSDRRLKRNIQPLKYGINDLMSIKTVTYNWKSDNNKTSSSKHIGFIAQNLAETIPEVVRTTSWVKKNEDDDQLVEIENENLGVSYSEILPVIVKSVQDQQRQIERNDKKISDLEQKITKQLKISQKLLNK